MKALDGESSSSIIIIHMYYHSNGLFTLALKSSKLKRTDTGTDKLFQFLAVCIAEIEQFNFVRIREPFTIKGGPPSVQLSYGRDAEIKACYSRTCSPNCSL